MDMVRVREVQWVDLSRVHRQVKSEVGIDCICERILEEILSDN